MKSVLVFMTFFLCTSFSFTPDSDTRPVVTFYRERFGRGPQEDHDVWRVSLKLQEVYAEQQTFFVAWNISFKKEGKDYRLDLKNSIRMGAGQSFRTKELYIPYGKDYVIQYVKLFREEVEIPVDVKFKR